MHSTKAKRRLAENKAVITIGSWFNEIRIRSVVTEAKQKK